MTKPDCSNCLMVKQQKFLKQLKCCSFLPFRPNFLASIGSKHVSTRYIKTRLGLVPSASYVKLFLKSEYGNNPDLVCDYFDCENCRIWPYRPSVCRTYFCTNQTSMNFKDTKFQNLENHLAQVVLFQMGFTLKEVQYEIDFYNKLIDGDESVCYALEVDFDFYEQCHLAYLEIENWAQWLGPDNYNTKLQWEQL
ncbi:MAG: hypothetical protein MK008_12375 [Bdellovibrionales bacterium]|nr:hypothetical protein [Bdellovibrionales bacterium]